MSKDLIPLSTPDLSSFARALGRQMKERGDSPSHLEIVNMLARAAGFRNHQHLRAAHAANLRLSAPPPPEIVDYRQVERALALFDDAGRFVRWPARRQMQVLALWALWAGLPAEQPLGERQVTALLRDAHLFGDAALLRRELCDMGLLRRNRDGSRYERCEKRPPAEARDLIRRLRGQRAK